MNQRTKITLAVFAAALWPLEGGAYPFASGTLSYSGSSAPCKGVIEHIKAARSIQQVSLEAQDAIRAREADRLALMQRAMADSELWGKELSQAEAGSSQCKDPRGRDVYLEQRYLEADDMDRWLRLSGGSANPERVARERLKALRQMRAAGFATRHRGLFKLYVDNTRDMFDQLRMTFREP